jgi:alanine racemase
MPVVKADAYGHGAERVARELETLPGIGGFAVARPEEGVALRESGISAPIVVCSPSPTESYPALERHQLAAVVSGIDQIEELERYAGRGAWRPSVHLKVDTGMHRLGVSAGELDVALRLLRSSERLRWDGLLSHLADAELADSPHHGIQEQAFDEVLSRLTEEERSRLTLHFANSAGALRHPRTRFDVVRVGLALYGAEIAGAELGLEPVLAVRACVSQIKAVSPGGRVGYGGRWVAARPSRIGVIGVGYADGYPWSAGNAAEALVEGRRVPVVGAVSMDLAAIDLTDTTAATGDEVVLVGRQGESEILVGELAERARTIPYEVLCHLSLRLPRRWIGSAPPSAGENPIR